MQVELYRHLSSILDERKWKKESLDRKSRPNKDASGDSADPNVDDRTGQAASGPDDHQRLASGRKSTDPGSKPPGHSLTLTAYYKSNIAERTRGFSQAYLQSREGGYGRQQTDLSHGGRRLMMERATRLLPRSRRELEHVALGLKEAKPRPKRKHNDAIQRYLSTPQSMFIDPEKLGFVRALIQEADQTTKVDDANADDAAYPNGTDAAHPTGTNRSAHSSGTFRSVRPTGSIPSANSSGAVRSTQPSRTVSSAYSSATGDRGGSSESDEEDKEVILGLEETVSNVRLRNVALKIGAYHQELNDERKENIFFSVFDNRRMPDKKQSVISKMTRPRMTPGSTKIPFDKESSDETLTLVEDKLRRFYSGLETKDNDSPVVQQLRRFRIAVGCKILIPRKS